MRAESRVPAPTVADPPALAALRLRAEACTGCGLAEGRTRVVFGEGDASSPLMLVGEGPGETEDLTGRPFVGRAGELLDRSLRDNGITRDDVFIANTVKCRACDRREGKAFNRPPTDAEVAACRPWLMEQIALIRPKVILCVGAPSAKNLIRPDFMITKERGRYFPSEHARTILATLHPAYILRQSSATHDGGYSLLVADVAKAWHAARRLAGLIPPDAEPPA